MTLYIFDPSTKSLRLEQLPPEAWTYVTGKPETGDEMTPILAYERVPWLYRAVDIRAKAMQRLPYTLTRGRSKTDLSGDPKFLPLVRQLRGLLLLIEASLCLYGAAYLIKESNQFGLNVSPRWLMPETITPEYDEAQGLKSFKRRLKTRTIELAVDQVIYAWVPNLKAEIGPGTPPAQVALAAAGMLHNLDEFAAGYFKRGVVKATLLQVEGVVTPEARQELETWWKRLLSGVKNAFNSVAISNKVNPVVIGDSLRETQAPELTQQKREDVATALGVPQTLLWSNAANFATAQQDALSFYTETIEPESLLIQEALNTQWLEAEGLRLEFQPNRLEIYQQYELQKAEAISKVVGKPIMTRNEGRGYLELDPIPEWDEEDTRPAPDPIELEMIRAQSRTQPPAERTPEQAGKALDLERWQRKALKRGAGVPFEPDYLSDREATLVREAIAGKEGDALKHAFEEVRAALSAEPFRGQTGRSDAGGAQAFRGLEGDPLQAWYYGASPDHPGGDS